MKNLSAAAHLIHGSSEGRFKVTYCTKTENLTKEEINSVGYEWESYDVMSKRFKVDGLSAGMHTNDDGEEYFFVPNPALGLWASKERFELSKSKWFLCEFLEKMELIKGDRRHFYNFYQDEQTAQVNQQKHKKIIRYI